MNKSELISAIYEQEKGRGIKKKDVEEIINNTFDSISTRLEAGDKIQLAGFGTFKVGERKEREGINPQTGQKMLIPPKKVPTFKPGKSLKDRINK